MDATGLGIGMLLADIMEKSAAADQKLCNSEYVLTVIRNLNNRGSDVADPV